MTNKGKPILPKNGEKSEKKKENIVFANGQLTYACNDVHVIPEKLIESFCTKTKRLDLSYNLLYTLKGLENFTDLEELVLDNNWIDDDTEFPALNSLHTLTLNKNNISDLESFLLKLKASYTNLKYLSLLGNNACPNQLSDKEKDDGDYQRYRVMKNIQSPDLPHFLNLNLAKMCDMVKVDTYILAVIQKGTVT
ncbi:leucine-rich melanocyte differentiation-associated protein [Octopus vulgaris]|uniref:Leucine-rich melanocyte differentiation-associated protein n=1 Tax=Octopus vulgaris TaxID=6645 RepID=A0AA36ALT4_OCTVU|nr:leucine-rich melanocyte differentiation-associated protein [Octopus vulgaris]